MIADKIIKGAVKLIAKQFKLDKVLKYVEEDNELDIKISEFDKRIDMLERMAHPKREFVVCAHCQKKIRPYNE
tara:strand:- start:456 stop:674 length:219 start_codon:yes stop_codon:yes gene_type:complete